MLRELTDFSPSQHLEGPRLSRKISKPRWLPPHEACPGGALYQPSRYLDDANQSWVVLDSNVFSNARLQVDEFQHRGVPRIPDTSARKKSGAGALQRGPRPHV